MNTPHVCKICGKTHEGLPLDIAFGKPGAYLETPVNRRKATWKLTDETCVFRKNRFFIRGCLPVLIHETQEPFIWGLWAEVSHRTFLRYQEIFSADGSNEPVHPGALSVEHEPNCRGMDQLPVAIRFGLATRRPQFRLERSNHWLCRDQENGVSLHRLHQMMHVLFPKHF